MLLRVLQRHVFLFTFVAAAGFFERRQLVQHEQQLATMQAELEQKDKLSEGLQLRVELQQSKVRVYDAAVVLPQALALSHPCPDRHST